MSRNLPNEITSLDSRVTVVENTGGGQPFAMPSYTMENLPSAASLPYSEVIISDAVRADSGLGVKAIALQNSGGSWDWYHAADYSRILKTAAKYLSQLTGSYSTAEQNAITAFYSAISSLLPKMAAIYLGRVKNSGDSLINLISNEHTATLESGGPGFTADAGWGTGAGLFNTNFNPTIHGRWTSTAAVFGAYYETVGTGQALNGITQDASSGGQRVYLSPDPGGNTEYALNSPSDSIYAGFSAGLWSVRRSGTAIILYQENTAVGAESNTASNLLNDTLTMTGHGTGYRISMLYIAEGLSAGEISTLNSAYNTLRATL